MKRKKLQPTGSLKAYRCRHSLLMRLRRRAASVLMGVGPAGLLVGLALAVLVLARPCQAQDIEPRRWSHLPEAGNFAGAAYSVTTGDILFEPELRIENAQVDLQTFAGKYIRSFELLGKSARVDVIQPYQIGHWTGLLNGVPAKVDREGWADTTLRFAVNLFGAPPLAGQEFADYRARTERETIVGMGLVVQLPTGQYDQDKLINLGFNRFAFRPQLGVVHDWGKWSAELTTAASIFADNDQFYQGTRLQQDPMYSADGHLIYTFRPGLWLSASVGYGGGGTTAVNSVANDNQQSNLGWGLGLGIPINRAVGLKFAYIGTRTQARTGLDADTFTFGVAVAW